MAELLATGCFEQIDQDLSYRMQDTYTKQVPRLRDLRCKPLYFACVNLWTESVYMLQVEDAEPVAVKDVYAWNANLVEERFATVPETACITCSTQSQSGTMIVPKILSSSRGVPVFVPSIPKMCNALLDQLAYLTNRKEDFSWKGARPEYNLRNFIRYLYFERQSQLEVLLPQLAERNRTEMERRAKAFKRKPTLAMVKESMREIH